ncbi:hypothetical protein [Bradyrhizobium sp. USDA 4513]
MGHHVDLAKPRRRIVPVIERPDRPFTAHRRIKPDPPAGTDRRGEFGLDQQAINRGCADAESSSARSASSSLSRPCRSSEGNNVGTITFSRLPQIRSEAFHSATSASLIVAP